MKSIKHVLRVLTAAAIGWSATVAQAGTVVTEIDKRYDANAGTEVIGGMAVDRDSNVIVTGWAGVSATGTGLRKYFTAKYDSYGRLKWLRHFSPPNGALDTPSSTVTVDANGNAYIALAQSYHFGAIVKYDPAGNESVLTLGASVSPFWDWSIGLRTDAAGNLYLRAANAVEKYSPQGALLWRQQFQTYFGNWIRDIRIDAAGNVYAAGYGIDGSNRNAYPDVVLAKFNAAGNRLWSRVYDSGYYEQGLGLELKPDGNLVVLATRGTPAAPTGTTLLTFDPNGNLLSNFGHVNGGTQDVPTAMRVGEDGNITVLSTVDGDIHTARYAPNGVRLWSARYANTWIDQPRGLDVDPLGNTVVVGGSETGQHWSNSQFITLRYDANGVQQFARREINGYASHVKVGPTGEIWVAGHSYYPFDAVVLRYREFNGVCQ
ncbi:hypothetical protein [Ideonella sp. A 288]|uniref:hypothetical protein n=1 Tax=Ideonella sp. A 288 TaxID=1962181 RepID=UPI0011851855|nr:hypothetical protein [Ideonella sp. A 288]